MNPESFIEQILFSTLRLELFDASGRPTSIGTAFLVKEDIPNVPNKVIVLLVSNKHVFEGSAGFVVDFHRRSPHGNQPVLGEIIRYQTPSFDKVFYTHPDPNVDLACLDITTVVNELQGEIFYKWIDKSFFATFKETTLDAGQGVLFFGYPDNRYDQKNNLPIVRSGVTASHPKVDFNGIPQFLIDAQVFPGSSGSPVFLNVKQSELNRGIHVIGGMPFLFVGVVASTMIRNNVINFVQTQFTPLSQEVIGLGLVFKATALVELIGMALDGFLKFRNMN